MLDFTFNTRAASDAARGTTPDALGPVSQDEGQAGELFASALAALSEEPAAEGDEEPDGEPTGDPSVVVDATAVVAEADLVPQVALGWALVNALPADAMTAGSSESAPGTAAVEAGADADALAATSAVSAPAVTPVSGSVRGFTTDRGAGADSAAEAITVEPSAASARASESPAGATATNAVATGATGLPGAVEAPQARPAEPSPISETAAWSPTSAAPAAAVARSAADAPAASEPVATAPVADVPLDALRAVSTGSDDVAAGVEQTEQAEQSGRSEEATTPSTSRAANAVRGTRVDAEVVGESAESAAPTEAAQARVSPVGERQTQDSGNGSTSNGQAGFGLGHGSGAHQLAPALKLASVSFANALANTPATETLPSETGHQIVQSLRLQWAQGGGDALIKLDPQHFGELRIALKVERGQVSARLEAEAPVVREWLQTNQAALKGALAEQNLTLERLEVTAPRESRDADRRQAGRDDQSGARQQQRRRRASGGELFEVVA